MIKAEMTENDFDTLPQSSPLPLNALPLLPGISFPSPTSTMELHYPFLPAECEPHLSKQGLTPLDVKPQESLLLL